MTTGLTDLLERALDGEPPAPDVARVYDRVELLRRRRIRSVLAAAAGAVVVLAAAGWGVAVAMTPGTPARTAPSVTPAAAGAPDPVPGIIAGLTGGGRQVRATAAARGDGWRQYVVRDAEGGRPEGLLEISVYDRADGLCFPVLADPKSCARPQRRGLTDYVRYVFDGDVDRQTTQVIARRFQDGRTVAVQATGVRGTGDADRGRPPLTNGQVTDLAADPDLPGMFGDAETCDSRPVCPVLRVPVR